MVLRTWCWRQLHRRCAPC